MYCPNCGTSTTLDQKFCRGCGIGLSPVSQVLENVQASQPQSQVQQKPQNHWSGSNRHDLFRWGFITFWGGIVLAALLGIVGDSVASLIPRLGGMIENMAGIGGIVLLVGIGMMVYSRLAPKVLQSPHALPTHPNYVNQPRAISEPPASAQAPFSSVTEHTTYNLDPYDGGRTRQ